MNNKFNMIGLSEYSDFEQILFAKRIYRFLFALNFEYPKFSKWYWSLYDKSGYLLENREILMCVKDDNILGVSILKRDDSECKICTLRVAKAYQNQGIGCMLIEKSFEYLNNDKPLITIHISKYHDFKNIFDRYNFSLEQEIYGYYGLLKSELAYNGILNDLAPQKTSFIKKASNSLEKMIYNYPSKSKLYIPNTGIIRTESDFLLI